MFFPKPVSMRRAFCVVMARIALRYATREEQPEATTIETTFWIVANNRGADFNKHYGVFPRSKSDVLLEPAG